jgi:hypothetical protein
VLQGVETANQRKIKLGKKVTKVHLNTEITSKGKNASQRSKKTLTIGIADKLNELLRQTLKRLKI